MHGEGCYIAEAWRDRGRWTVRDTQNWQKDR